MARRGPSGVPQQQMAPPGASSRQNEYFLPRDGIDREVITADICRYLGNDALVRPGAYENPTTGQVSQGYYITAYRNLTSAMIDDLKADSARWEQERRMQSSRNPSGVHYRSADYRSSETYARRQGAGPSGNSGYDDRDPYAPRYPGSDAPGYSGSSSANSYGQPTPGNQYSVASSGAYPAGGYPAQGQYPTQDPRYPNQGMQLGGFPGQQDPYVDVGANMRSRDPRDPNQQAYRDQPQYPGGPASRDIVMTTAPGPNPSYATAAPQQGYPQSSGFGHPYGQQQAVGNPFGQPMQQPHDMLFGRSGYPAASTATAKDRTTSPVAKTTSDRYPAQAAGHASASYGAAQVQYEEQQPAVRAPAQPNASARRTEKESSRHQSDRYHKGNHR